jgi:hypothetical protein
MNDTLWAGWIQRAPPGWQKACEAKTLTLCTSRLRRIADREGIPLARSMITGGHIPLSPLVRQVRMKRRSL